MITLTDIAYVRSGVADLDAAIRFATGIVGLELVDAGRGRAWPTCAPTTGTTAWPWSRDPPGSSPPASPWPTRTRWPPPRPSWSASGLGVHRGVGRRSQVPAGAGVHRLRRPVRQPAGAGQPAGDDGPAGGPHRPAGHHRVRPPVPGRARCARGLPVLEHALQRPGVRLARRRGLPHAHRPRAPQARRLPRRRAGPVPHELPGRRHRRRVQELAFPGRARRRDRDGPGSAPAVRRDLPVLPRPRGVHLRVLLRRQADRGRRGLGTPHLRPGRARLHRHVARPHQPPHHSAPDPLRPADFATDRIPAAHRTCRMGPGRG